MSLNGTPPSLAVHVDASVPLRVLHVEDSEGDAELVLRELRRGGYQVQYARVDTAAGMKAALAEGTWDVVLTDWELPAFSGAAALARLRTSGLDLPVIIVSGVIGEDIAVAALKNGAHDYVIKNNLHRLVPAVQRELAEVVIRRERNRAEAEVAARAHAAVLGADVGTALICGTDLQSVFQGCVNAIARHLDAAFVGIWALDANSQMLELKASTGLDTHPDGPQHRVPMGKFTIGTIAAQRTRQQVAPISGDSRVCEQVWAARQGVGAFAGYSMTVGNRVVGVVGLYARQPLTALALDALGATADHIALGIERQRVETARREEAEVAGGLARMGRALISGLTSPALPERLCQLTTEILRCDFSVTLLADTDEQGEVFVPLASYGGTPEEWEAARVLRLQKELFTVIPARLTNEEVVQVVPAEGIHPLTPQFAKDLKLGVLLYMALRRDGNLFGFHIAGYRDPHAVFNWVQRGIASGTAHLASMALEHFRMLEELKSANRLKSDFVATISHELRTPLNIIIGYNDLLIDRGLGPLTPGQDNTLRAMHRSANGLLEVISATLDLSRLEAGQSPLDLREIALQDLLGEIDAETRDLQQASGLRFAWAIAACLPRVYTDAIKLKVVLKNLISNAVKFTEHGSVLIDVRTRDGGVEFTVTDTGIGIPAEMLPVIFDLFRQVDTSTTRTREGVGLGLYIVRRLVELLGGSVSVDSVVGQGSTFRIWIPERIAARGLPREAAPIA